MRDIADQQQTDPANDHTGHTYPDLMGQRYDALAAWSESAETMTMAAVRAEPSPAYAPGLETGRGPSRRARVAVLATAGVAVLAAAATVTTWGGDEPEEPVAPVAAPKPVESAVATVTVTSGAVTAGQSGSTVTFRPSGSTVPASGSISFSFALAPVPTEPPTGCALDGRPCS